VFAEPFFEKGEVSRVRSFRQRPSRQFKEGALDRTLLLELESALAAELIPRLNRRRLVPGGFPPFGVDKS